jgi:hypothetical protein
LIKPTRTSSASANESNTAHTSGDNENFLIGADIHRSKGNLQGKERRANLRAAARPINGKEKEERGGRRNYADSRQQQHEPGPEKATLLAKRQIETGCALQIIVHRCITPSRVSQPSRRTSTRSRLCPAPRTSTQNQNFVARIFPESTRVPTSAESKKQKFNGSKNSYKEDVMKLINPLKLNTVKTTLTRTAAVALVAAAAFLATPAKANAQVAFGVRVGPVAVYHRGPVYARPYVRPYVRPYGYYAPAPVIVEQTPAYGYYGPRVYARPYYHNRLFVR